jgi:hypothetical protein
MDLKEYRGSVPIIVEIVLCEGRGRFPGIAIAVGATFRTKTTSLSSKNSPATSNAAYSRIMNRAMKVAVVPDLTLPLYFVAFIDLGYG